MTRSNLSRLRRLEAAEIGWRARGAADNALHRLLAASRRPRWRRQQLVSKLAPSADLAAVCRELKQEHWLRAHSKLASYFKTQPPRFVIAPGMRDNLASAIQQRFPAASNHARQRGDQILRGRYEVLGYRDLAFDGRSWHTDVAAGRTAPLVFWSKVPYLSPECGDHKVTWEFNRHQHWMELGRAYWLTGDSRYRAECLRQLKSWLSANPPLVGINWASMLELAFRSLSWLWALNFFVDGGEEDSDPWLVDLLVGLDRQLTHVERHLSYYFSPNTHLIGEAVALYVAGRVLPLLKASERRETVGRRVLVQEIGRQIAADGGHCERSAHYHRYTLDFYLLALAVARITHDPLAGLFERACGRLAQAARLLADDRGRLPHIGDDDGGSVFPLTRRPTDDASDSLAAAAVLTNRVDLLIGEPPEEVWWLLGHDRFAGPLARLDRAAAHTTLPSSALPATGYYISRNEQGDHLIVDAGPHGYLNGGHAHADALALTFSLRGTPLLIDTGTGCYTTDPAMRDRFRSTALHNTLTLNRRSQSIPRGPFHWSHTSDATARRWRTNGRFDYFVGLHDSYAPLRHYRHLLVVHGDLLVVADCVVEGSGREVTRHAALPSAAGNMDAAVHWHVHPDWAVSVQGSQATLDRGSASLTLNVTGTLEHFVADEATGLGWWSPVYGRIEPASTLRTAATGRAPCWLVSVFALHTNNRVQSVNVEPFDASTATLSHGATIRIAREGGIDRLVIAESREGDGHERWCLDGVVSDARMLFTCETVEGITSMALVDATLVSSNRHPEITRNYSSPVADLFIDMTGRGEREPEERKAS